MARTALTVQSATSAGAAITLSAANVDGHSFPARAGILFWVFNGSGGSITVTVPTPGTIDGLAVADQAVSVPAGAHRLINPQGQSVYSQSDGNVYVDFSAVTSVTCAAFQV